MRRIVTADRLNTPSLVPVFLVQPPYFSHTMARVHHLLPCRHTPASEDFELILISLKPKRLTIRRPAQEWASKIPRMPREH